MNIDERIEAVVVSVELLLRETEELRKIAHQHTENLRADSENIRALARIAEIHERRLTDLEHPG
jgi:hypothetical protein